MNCQLSEDNWLRYVDRITQFWVLFFFLSHFSDLKTKYMLSHIPWMIMMSFLYFGVQISKCPNLSNVNT